MPPARIGLICPIDSIAFTEHDRCDDCGILLGTGHMYGGITYVGLLLDPPCIAHRRRMADPVWAMSVNRMRDATAAYDASLRE